MTDLSALYQEQELWTHLQRTDKPIVLYGMGDGALKILRVFEQYGIQAAGMFASDDFARGHSFAGFPVRTLTQTEELFGEFIIVLAFGTERPELLAYLEQLAKKHEFYAPDVPVCPDDTTLFTLEYFQKHKEAFQTVFGRLADDRSRAVLLDVLRYKITGNVHFLTRATTPTVEIMSSLLPLDDCEDFVDLGAYNGDTVQRFLRSVSDYSSITAFEPDPKNFLKLCRNTAHLDRLQAHNLGAHSKPDTLLFARKAGRQSALSKDGIPTPVSSVDAVLNGRRASYIKFDVEGAEEQALLGCRNTIMTHQPKLAISAYHRNSDLWKLPQVLWSIDPSYRIFLRHHPYFPAWETNFYGLPLNFDEKLTDS